MFRGSVGFKKQELPITTPGVYHNPTLGLLSYSSDGSTWHTIADKNLGASTLYNSGDTMSETNCGGYYQWGNNYMFPFSGSISNTSTSTIDASTYGPGNYYSSDVFRKIQYGDWSSVQNDNLWGNTTNTLAARQGPCATGYHVPTSAEFSELIDMLGANLKSMLFLPDMGRIIYSTNIDARGTVGYYWTSTTNNSGSIFLNTNSPGTATWNRPNAMPIRPFKNEAVQPTTRWVKLI